MSRISQSKKDLIVKKSLESPLSQLEFCREQGVAPSTLYKWIKKSKQKIAVTEHNALLPGATPKFIEAVINDQLRPGTPSKMKVLIITTPAGCIIEVPL